MVKLKIGLVGKPSSGKSTFLSAATLAEVKRAAYPFTTIDTNKAVGFVRAKCPCKEMNVKCDPKNSKCINGDRMIPVNILDVAGLVPGAHKGKGMGSEFLDDLRKASGLIHILDISGTTNEKGEKTKGYDPLKDVYFLEEEINLWFLKILKRDWASLSRKVNQTKKKLVDVLTDKFSGLGTSESQIRKALEENNLKEKRAINWSNEDLEEFTFTLREISKPILISANKIDLSTSIKNFKRLKSKFKDLKIIPTCAEAELALRRANKKGLIEYVPGDSNFEILEKIDKEQKEALNFIKERILKVYGGTGIQKAINTAVFDLLDMIVIYPVANVSKLSDQEGNVLPDAFLIKKGTTLKEFAEKIHSEIAERFIGGINARTEKKIGANYKLNDGDIIKILFRK